MITVYRFAPEIFSNDLSGAGARIYGGRWNSIGIPAIYTSFTISLALVELFIHKRTYEEIVVNQLMEITIADTIHQSIDHHKIKNNWQNDASYSQYMGSEFLLHKKSLGIKVPSAIIEQESNVVLNPLAPDFNKKVKIKTVKPFLFDGRLFK
ncbi:MAG: RES domain-containing protein [Chitinophagaceae bacterium]|nr:RES domain-containing protein [Chitinophagaceae bacterium]